MKTALQHPQPETPPTPAPEQKARPVLFTVITLLLIGLMSVFFGALAWQHPLIVLAKVMVVTAATWTLFVTVAKNKLAASHPGYLQQLPKVLFKGVLFLFISLIIFGLIGNAVEDAGIFDSELILIWPLTCLGLALIYGFLAHRKLAERLQLPKGWSLAVVGTRILAIAACILAVAV